MCQNGNCTNLDRIMYGISNYTCECDLGWYFNVTTGACTNKKPCPANTFGPDLLSGCECDNMAGYFGSGVTLNSSDCNPICRLENLCIDGGCFNAVHGQVWFDGDTVELQCLHGYRGGGLYTCNVASSPYMKGTAQCTENVCGAYTLPTNVIGGDTDPCTTGIQLSPILDHECHVKCAPGFSGTPATISCLLNSVNGEYPSGSITCMLGDICWRTLTPTSLSLSFSLSLSLSVRVCVVFSLVINAHTHTHTPSNSYKSKRYASLLRCTKCAKLKFQCLDSTLSSASSS